MCTYYLIVVSAVKYSALYCYKILSLHYVTVSGQISVEPTWREGTHCQNCQTKFSISTRKHHWYDLFSVVCLCVCVSVSVCVDMSVSVCVHLYLRYVCICVSR